LNFTGLDFSSYCIEYCKKRFLNDNFILLDLKTKDSKEIIQKFSIIILLEVLEHITDDESVIRK
jgi:hypothetical protein